MKHIILLSSSILFIVNLLFGAILSSYGAFNIIISSIVILTTGVLLYVTDSIRLKDGFKVSLMLLFSMGGVIEFILSLVAPNRLTDNWEVIIILLFITFEAIMLIVTNTITHKVLNT